MDQCSTSPDHRISCVAEGTLGTREAKLSAGPPRCSSQALANFVPDLLLSGHCLLDKPEAPLNLPATFPGKDYDADRQCQLTFGPDSRHCPQLPPPCAALWCSGHLNGHAMCQTKHSPWADGTPCGPTQACMGGRCLHVDQLKDYNVRLQGMTWVKGV